MALYSAVAAKDNARAGHLGLFGTWSPAWHHPEGTDVQYGMTDCPSPAIHPSSGQAVAFEPNVDAKGPIGLFLQAIASFGASVDNELNITQWKEQSISIIHTPYLFIPTLVTAPAERGNQRAAAGLKDFTKGLQEIDAKVTNAGSKGFPCL